MRKWESRIQKVELLAKAFQRKPLASCYKPRLWPCQPSSIWKLFPRQSMAISFAQSCKEDVHIFALEKEQASLGQRIYLVTSYSELWHYYRTYRQSLMHCYEVIPEGAVCKLYFDLEFYRPSNEGLDGKSMVSSLVQYVCEKLMEVYQVACSAKNVLNLDSSTEEKFSRHLIFILSNEAFKDNIHVAISAPANSIPGKERGSMEGPQAKKQRLEERDLGFLVVKSKDGQQSLFVDLGVYTKNRNFRLYKSSKAGKNAAFTVAEDNEFVPKTEMNVTAEESLFLASLISNVSYTGQRILTWDVANAESDSGNAVECCKAGSKRSSVSLAGYQGSPHQDVDDYVLTMVKKDGVQGSIRRWHYFASEQLIVYDILKYRWCENVGRFHKSNNIMILVNLKEEVWYQKCHDPACTDFRSSSYPLPQEICVSYLMTMVSFLNNLQRSIWYTHFQPWKKAMSDATFLIYQDEEKQSYLMDNAGNIQLSQAAGPGSAQQSTTHSEEGVAGSWSDGTDDQAYLEVMEDFEGNTVEVSDQLLLQCMTDFDSCYKSM
ncbi:DNA-directed primase/polymerase protein [Aplochiton taeniatus]